MVSKIIDGIKNSLLTEYPNCKVYLNSESTVQAPCFSIVNIKSTQEQKMGSRFWCENTFSIEYSAQNKASAYEEFSSIVNDLMMLLEYVEVDGDLIHGTKMNSKVEDGKFCFFVNYDIFVLKSLEPIPLMEKLYQEDELKIPKEN